MGDTLERDFPSAFGNSPEDFLQQYEALIYKVIFEWTRENFRFEPEDLFNEFFVHIADDNFRRLRTFHGESRPTTYLGSILRNFICDKYRKLARTPVNSLNEIEELRGECLTAVPPDQEDIFSAERIHKAFDATFSRLSNREKLILDLSMDEGMHAKEIGNLLGISVKSVYKNAEKVKRILREELKKRGAGEK